MSYADLSPKEREEVTVYRVTKVPAQKGVSKNMFKIEKRVLDVPVESYMVTAKLTPDGMLDEESLWCDCPGFRIQKYEAVRHKHVRLVKHFLELGQPQWSEYRLKGGGKNTKIRYMRKSDD